MPFDVGDTLDRIHTYLAGSGHVAGGQQIGDYNQPPDTGNGPVAFIQLEGSSVYAITLGGQPLEQHVVQITIMLSALREPTSETEKILAVAATNIQADLLTEFDLGGSIRNVDPAGISGAGFATRWGYKDVQKEMYRVVVITIPMLIDSTDSAAA